MTITEFRRRCVDRQRMVRVADTCVFVDVSSMMAEHLFKRLNGAVAVDDSGEGDVVIAPARQKPDA